jgi:hypothetical protein
MSEDQEISLRLEAMRMAVEFYKKSNADTHDLIGMALIVYQFLKGEIPNE